MLRKSFNRNNSFLYNKYSTKFLKILEMALTNNNIGKNITASFLKIILKIILLV